MNIEIWSIGKENDAFIEEGVMYYFKKINHYCPISLELLNLPKQLHTTEITLTKKREAELILKKLSPHHYLLLLDERGKQIDSIQFSNTIQNLMNQSTKTLVFLIGGAYGVDDEITKRADFILSFSKFVFPHQLMRLILSEQIYRAFSIMNKLPYHHK